MLYRPNFCANCGEKIERAQWHLWTSRRFCDVCAADNPVHEYGPKALLAAASVIALAGSTALFSPNTAAVKQETPRKAVERVVVSPTPPERALAAIPQQAPPAMTVRAAEPAGEPKTETSMPAGEGIYYCGAETKKGTPCSRRVKGPVRCYQHKGMPAMLAQEKLRIE